MWRLESGPSEGYWWTVSRVLWSLLCKSPKYLTKIPQIPQGHRRIKRLTTSQLRSLVKTARSYFCIGIVTYLKVWVILLVLGGAGVCVCVCVDESHWWEGYLFFFNLVLYPFTWTLIGSALLLKYPDGLCKIQHQDCLCKVTSFVNLSLLLLRTYVLIFKKLNPRYNSKNNFISSHRAGNLNSIMEELGLGIRTEND